MLKISSSCSSGAQDPTAYTPQQTSTPYSPEYETRIGCQNSMPIRALLVLRVARVALNH